MKRHRGDASATVPPPLRGGTSGTTLGRDLDDLLAALGYERPSWQRDAACREHQHLDWFSTNRNDVTACLAVCLRCLVVTECQIWAIGDRTMDPAPVLGGMNTAARRAARRLLEVDDETA